MNVASSFQPDASLYRGMLRAAVQQARALGSTRILSSVALVRDSDARAAQMLLSDARRRLAEMEPGLVDSHEAQPRYATRASITLAVCDPNLSDRIREIGPEQPDRIVEFRIGERELAIPMRYLISAYWLNVPFGRSYGTSASLVFGWPGLQDMTPHNARSCHSDMMSDCSTPVRVSIESRRSPDSDINAPHQSSISVPIIVEERRSDETTTVCTWLRRVDASPRDNSPRARGSRGVCTLLLDRVPSLRVIFHLTEQTDEERWQIAPALAARVSSFVRQ